MKRLFFVMPSLRTAQILIDELLLKRISIDNIHVIAKEDTHIGDLPAASPVHKSDLVTAIELGMTIGGISGVLVGVAAIIFPPAGLVLGSVTVLGAGLVGAGLGALVSGLIGMNLPNRWVAPFREAIEAGGLLMVITIPGSRLTEIESLVNQHYPDLEQFRITTGFAAYP